MAMLGKFHEIAEPLYLHRQHPGRSVRRYTDPRERVAWFDPTRETTLVFPRWRLLWEYACAVRRVNLRSTDRARLSLALGAWAVANARALATDVRVNLSVLRGNLTVG
jgi:hypothetical protein